MDWVPSESQAPSLSAFGVTLFAKEPSLGHRASDARQCIGDTRETCVGVGIVLCVSPVQFVCRHDDGGSIGGSTVPGYR